MISEFMRELEQLLNKHSMENGSNTPDFLLAKYISRCLITFNLIVNDRERWYGRPSKADNAIKPMEPTPLLMPSSSCPNCNGSGTVDSGGMTPWGSGIGMPCGCMQPPMPETKGEK